MSTSSISSAAVPLSSRAALIATAPSWGAVTFASWPKKDPIGVRRAATITTSSTVRLQSRCGSKIGATRGAGAPLGVHCGRALQSDAVMSLGLGAYIVLADARGELHELELGVSIGTVEYREVRDQRVHYVGPCQRQVTTCLELRRAVRGHVLHQ